MNDTTLEALLSQHFRAPPAHAEDEQLQSLAYALTGPPGAPEHEELQHMLRNDPQMRQAVALVQSCADTPSGNPRIVPWRGARPWFSMLAVAAAGLLSFLAMRSTEPPGADLRVKGAGDMLFVGADRQGHRSQIRPLDAIAKGDELGFFYSAEAPGYLVIGYRDEGGEALVLEPAEASEARPVAAGEHVALPDGVVVEQGAGCEWFVAAFFDTAVPVSQVRDALQGATFDANGCVLHVEVPGARSISVLPTRRP